MNDLDLKYRDKLARYFLAFQNKNLQALNLLISDDVYLKDWEVRAEGRKAFLKNNKDFFAKVNTIYVRKASFFKGDVFFETEGIEAEDTIFCFIEITVDGGEPISVLDVIFFNKEGKICGVLAYKQ